MVIQVTAEAGSSVTVVSCPAIAPATDTAIKGKLGVRLRSPFEVPE